ncbi:MAG TPA: fused MFS/spermidine synthase [Candidatus Limnocylindrales bacterium]
MLPLFGVAIFLAAGLVFLVQPMVAKALLPTFGGTPQVWTASLLFFQAALLGGYAYAHASVRSLGLRRQPLVHLLALAVPLVLLPIGLRGLELVRELPPAIAVASILAVSVGGPYLVVSATSPLLQRWFAVTGHRTAHDPYFLYAGGNAGSLVGLLAYPFLIEPRLRLGDQATVWSLGYLVFALLVGGCAIVAARRSGRAAVLASPVPVAAPRSATAVAPPLAVGRQLRWVGLAFIPSSLLLGVTTHVQTDIAAVPLLWVIPLSLYLVTFVLAFSRRRVLPPRIAALALPVLVLAVALSFIGFLPVPLWVTIAVHYGAFFVAAMLAHGRLADDRPEPEQLTRYYLLVSVGGALGGLFNAIIAPLAFDQVLEYPLALVLALLVRPPMSPDPVESRARRRARLLDIVAPFGVYLATLLGLVAAAVLQVGRGASTWLVVAILVGCFVFVRRPVRYALGVAAVLAVVLLTGDRALFADRTFFGVNRVIEDDAGRHVYLSGRTVHGVQRVGPGGGRLPMSYYHPSGPAGQVFSTIKTRPGGIADVAVIGLGAGGLAAYADEGQRYVFYEIDPAVIAIARDERLFTFLGEAPADVSVVEGDGRLRIAEAAPASYDVIVLDAFSSDAIPAHLVTREALGVYLDKLRPDGILLFNVSNSYLDVRAVVAGALVDHGLAGYSRTDSDLSAAPPGDKETSEWVVAARDSGSLDAFASDPRWQAIENVDRRVLWTDDFSDILGVIR